jgi:hypothetical protein
MKKVAAIGLAVMFAVFGLAACKKASSPADKILTLFPKTAQGVVVIDVKRAMSLDFVSKALKDPKNSQKYAEFIKETGIDPAKDIQAFAIGISGELKEGKTAGSGAGIISLTYNKETLLAKIKKEAPGITEQIYDGITMFAIEGPEKAVEEKAEEVEAKEEVAAKVEAAQEKEKEEAAEAQEETEKAEPAKPPMYAAFLDATTIAAGSESGVKAVIDVFHKKAENLYMNVELAALIKKANKNALVWSAFAFPPDMMKDVASKNPMASDLEAVKALTIYVDNKNKGFQIEIKGIGGDADKNKKLAETIIGLKALGDLIGGEKPEVGELLNKIEVTSDAAQVKIFVDVPQALMEKLSETAQKQVEEKMGATKGEEKKEEKKN